MSGTMDLFQAWSGVCLVQGICFRLGMEWSVSGAMDLFQDGVECVWCNGFIPGIEWNVSGTMDLFQAWSGVCLVQWI